MRPPLQIARDYLEKPEATAEQLQYVYDHLRLLPVPEHPAICATLARNPNVSPELFATLLPLVRATAVQNPAWPLFLMEGGFLERLSPVFVAACLRDETTPAALVEALTLHAREEIARAARLHVQRAGEAKPGWQEELLADWTTRLWRESGLVWLMRAGALPEVINQRLPYPLQPEGSLSEQECPKVLQALAQQKGRRLATVLAIAQHTHSPQEYETLATHAHGERRLAVALNPNTPPHLKQRLQHDGHSWVRAAAHLPQPTLLRGDHP
jgi:hypothetical protein